MWSFRPKVDAPVVALSSLVKVDSTDDKLACVASVSVPFRSKERGTRVKDRAKNGASNRTGRGGEERKETFPYPFPLFHFLVLV